MREVRGEGLVAPDTVDADRGVQTVLVGIAVKQQVAGIGHGFDIEAPRKAQGQIEFAIGEDIAAQAVSGQIVICYGAVHFDLAKGEFPAVTGLQRL